MLRGVGKQHDGTSLASQVETVLQRIRACDLPRYSQLGPVEILVFGAGPIGLLFVAALATEGHRVILADPNPGRLEIGKKLGAAETIEVARGGGQADVARAKTQDGRGVWIAIDATGAPEGWSDAIASLRSCSMNPSIGRHSELPKGNGPCRALHRSML